MDEKIQEIFEEFKTEFKDTKELKEIWEEGKEHLTPLMMTWARAKYYLLFGEDTDKEVAKDILKGITRAIADIVAALQSKLKNYLLEKLESVLKTIVTKYLLPVLLQSVM